MTRIAAPVVLIFDRASAPDVMTKCPFCGEAWTAADIADFESTWQQWRCGACGSWVDREAPADELAHRNAAAELVGCHRPGHRARLPYQVSDESLDLDDIR